MNKFGSGPLTHPKSEIDGIPVSELAERFGTPFL